MLAPENSVAILGFGVEGQAVLKYLLKHGYFNITVLDKDPHANERFSDGNVPTIKWQLGADYLGNLDHFDVIFRSPGFHFLLPELFEATDKGVKITSSTSLFMKNARGTVVGVTGTKGKGTTSTLIARILREAGLDVHIGGNIGSSPLDFMDELTEDSVSVLELSSFQLQDLDVSPHISVVLNTTIEHLDYHAHMEEYWEAKAHIVRHQMNEDYVVVNQDYNYAPYFLGLTPAQPILVSTKGDISGDGGDREDHVPVGAFLQEDALVMKMPSGELRAICKKDEIGLIGPHNLENVLPAACVGAIFNVDSAAMKAAIAKFHGLPHRLEMVGEVEGVKYYNDSFSTTPETCMAAMKSFSGPVVLMVGGSEKNSDFERLAQKIIKNKNIKAVIFMGDDAGKRLYEEVIRVNEKAEKDMLILASQGRELINRDIPLKMHRSNTFGEAFLAAKLEAEAGDVVLMSPACASFDWFENYKKRGEMFRELVKNLG